MVHALGCNHTNKLGEKWNLKKNVSEKIQCFGKKYGELE
jgi:hypothetical protein